jgi:signal transduction histidine kinase
MTHWLLRKRYGLLAFLVIAALVAGGLGWASAAALRLEREQLEAREHVDCDGQLRLALWRLDARLAPTLAREDSRPYNHYSAISAPALSLAKDGSLIAPGSVLEPSPLLNAELPDWMLLHFQAGDASGWASPQVLSDKLRDHLIDPKVGVALGNVTSGRKELLELLAQHSPPADTLLARARDNSEKLSVKDVAMLFKNEAQDQTANSAPNQAVDPQQANLRGNDSSYASRADQRNRVQKESQNPAVKDDFESACNNIFLNGENWLRASSRGARKGVSVEVNVGSLTPFWLTSDAGDDWLLLVRIVRIGSKEICQGIVLDGPRVETLLADEVRDIFPEARLLPVREDIPANPERAMATLPFLLDPGPPATINDTGMTPLRIGLLLAWTAALGALLAVGLGGRSLIDLSERRIRFVSAVTHELRTPLTTLRLYLDMLTGGMVKDEAKKAEYLHTLNAETDRLNRLVANVLDFSRLENQRPHLHLSTVKVSDLLHGIHATWQGRCQDAGKELVVENGFDPEAILQTDVELVQQIIANLIDNACKYSRDAADNRILLRATVDGPRLFLDVQDHGPGVTRRDRRSLFLPFRRGCQADVTAGGVGLGLALAHRWAALLGGKLSLTAPAQGACFRLELPSLSIPKADS